MICCCCCYCCCRRRCFEFIYLSINNWVVNTYHWSETICFSHRTTLIPFLSMYISALFALVSHNKSDWYPLIPTNYCHLSRLFIKLFPFGSYVNSIFFSPWSAVFSLILLAFIHSHHVSHQWPRMPCNFNYLIYAKTKRYTNNKGYNHSNKKRV